MASTTEIGLVTRARAALLTQVEDAVFVGLTAAALLALPVPVPVPATSVMHLGVADVRDRRPRPGVSSVVDTRRREIVEVDGLPVTTGSTLFLQLASVLPLVDLVVVGDAMVRRGLASPESLRKAAAAASCKGVLLARRAAGLVRERVDSPMGTRVRLLLVLAGFPEPIVNPTIDKRYRADLCWPDRRLIVEHQGQHHRADLEQWDHDIERGEYLEKHGWFIVEVVARDVFQRPEQLLERIHGHWLARGGRPLRRSQEWQSHFPVGTGSVNRAW